MARYDKYEPKGGGFRAPLAEATVAGEEFTAFGVGLDANGRVVKGAGQTGIVGLYIAHGHKNPGDIVDVMTDGEVVEADDLDAGTAYLADASGALVSTSETGEVALGFTVEATRLVVRAAR